MKKLMLKLWVVILGLILLIHFSITFMYNSPVNPIKEQFDREIQTYMTPLFTQNWRLFAPDPVSVDSKLYVRGIYTNKDGKKVHSKWINVTDPFIQALQKNRFTPLRLPLVAITGTMYHVQNQYGRDPDQFLKNLEKVQNDPKSWPTYISTLRNISSEALFKRYGRHFDQVEIRIYLEVFPDYYTYSKEKNSTKTKLYMIKLPLLEYHDVSPM